MPNKFKIIKPLIIGVGVAGKRHLEAQLKLGFQTGVYTQNPQTAQLLKQDKNVIVFENLEEAISWANLVHVCTPDDTHTKYVAVAVKNEKAVLCEKAFTTSLADALYLQKLAHQYNTTVIIGQNYRLTPSFAETKKLISKGELGKIKEIKTTYLHDVTEYQKRAPLRKNEDFLYIAGSHAVDLACWIADEPVVKIQAQIIKQATKNYPASYYIELVFASGSPAQIELDATAPREKSGTDLIVVGESGKLVSNNKSDSFLLYKEGENLPQSINLANNQTLTTKLEVQIIDEYLLGKQKSYWPLPNVDEALNIIRVLDTVQNNSSSDKNRQISDQL